jgi:hypothetical protein
VDLHRAKAAVAQSFAPGHPGREALLTLPEEMEVAAFDAVLVAIVRMLRMRMEST